MSISSSWIARVTGVSVEYTNFYLGRALSLPQKLAVIGQGNTLSTYAETPFLALSAAQVGAAVGYGSPLHLAALQLFPANGDGIGGIPVMIYPLVDDDAGVVAAGAIECVGEATEDATFRIEIGGISTGNITFEDEDTAAVALGKIKTAINAVAEMPVIAGTVAAGSLPLTAKWKGESGNDISIDIDDLDIDGLTFASVAFASGAANPDVRDALDQIGERWETMILNCMNYDDDTILDYYVTWNEGRWLADVKKPALVASGCVDDFATRTVVTDARKDDRTNFLIVGVDSLELPFVIAARGLVKDIIVTANDHPAMNYKGILTGLDAGADIDQEDGTVRNASVLLGSSTNKKIGDNIALQDIVTMYHPDAEGLYPAYRYVCDVVKLQNVIYNVDVVMVAYEGRPILPDEDPIPIDEDMAIQPKNIKTTLKNLAESLSKKAIIADLAFTKENISVEFDDDNPKRINTVFPVKLSGNVEVSDIKIKFGFYLP
jgi:phage tail sheath gpL-like